MFDLALSDEEELIRDTARRFAADELADHVAGNQADRAVPPDVVARYAATGLGTLDGQQMTEGQQMTALGRAIVLEELAAVDPGAAIALDGLGLAGYLAGASAAGTGHMAGAPAIGAGGRGRGAVVFDPDERIDLTRPVTSSFPWIPADDADVLAVVQSDRAGIARSGFRLTPVGACGCRAAGSSAVTLEGARFEVIDESAVVADAVARMRLSTAALLVGAARGAYEYARGYATERTAFGRPIAHHQALGFLIVEMAMAIDAARLSLWNAAHALDAEQGGPGGEAGHRVFAAASALVHAAEAGLFVGPNAVQVLGGHGFVADFPVEKFMRDIRTLPQLAGGHDAALVAAGELAGRVEVGLR